jgi:hypothetical protein
MAPAERGVPHLQREMPMRANAAGRPVTNHRNAMSQGTWKTSVQITAAVVGATFLLVGIAGFIPGITTHYGDMTFAEHDSGAQLLGIFGVSVLHNLVHLAFGVAGMTMSRTFRGARNFLIVGGIVYLVLWLYGLVIDLSSSANFVPVDQADNWLHFVLGIAMLILGIILGKRVANTRAAGL